MAKIYTSADQLIGTTPLLELTHIEKEFGLKAKLLAKLDYLLILSNFSTIFVNGLGAIGAIESIDRIKNPQSGFPLWGWLQFLCSAIKCVIASLCF